VRCVCARARAVASVGSSVVVRLVMQPIYSFLSSGSTRKPLAQDADGHGFESAKV
jgi:hypothetical protein